MGLLSRVTVGTTLQRLRREQAMTRVALAKTAGISPGLLCKIEIGECSCSLRALFAIAEALGMTPADVVRRIEDSTEYPGT